ncbi:hypothetical protein FS837_012979 [Tulasnella sp. UAMH 9824]|nr:hypothetical protein FS837_012979 [Tulasnella sp. UAMH 9824]
MSPASFVTAPDAPPEPVLRQHRQTANPSSQSSSQARESPYVSSRLQSRHTSSASTSTRADPARTATTAPTNMLAPYAVPAATPHATVRSMLEHFTIEVFGIVTPLRPIEWQSFLHKYSLSPRYPDLVEKIRYGFPIFGTGNDQPVLTKSEIFPNLSSATNNLSFIIENLLEEKELGRMAGPFTTQALEAIVGHFRSSPLGTVEKAGSPGALRVIRNLSHKSSSQRSINDFIESDEWPTRWISASDTASFIATCPEGTRFATMDIKAAYRIIPIHPQHRRFLVVSLGPENHWIDKTCPFGLSNAAGLEGEVADATVDLIRASFHVPFCGKWVDDIAPSQIPIESTTNPDGSKTFVYSFSIQDVVDAIAPLGIPWAPNKLVDFSTLFHYVGFEWDTVSRTVSFSEKKLSKYQAKIDVALSKCDTNARFTLKEILGIHGTLIHLSFVIREGRPHLHHIQKLISSFSESNRFQQRFASRQVKAELQWWKASLGHKPSRSVVGLGPVKHDIDIWVDASSSFGIGILIDDRFLAWKYHPKWKGWGKFGYDIGWAETVGLELVIRCLVALNLSDAIFFVHSDNVGAIEAIKKGHSRNTPSNESIIRMNSLRLPLNLAIEPAYFESKSNKADPISRGDFTGYQISSLTIELPEVLLDIFTRVDV